MEKAILKTLIYADIFNYPLKAYEIHKWLISKKATLQQVENALIRLGKKGKIESRKGFYFLKNRQSLVRKRVTREKLSNRLLFKAKIFTLLLKIIPSLNLVGISGGLAMSNAEKGDDIDLILITKKDKLWISRLLTIILLDLLGVRRKVNMSSKQAVGKLCVNIFLERNQMEQKNKDIYTAHEVLQMKVLWQKSGTYQKYLEDNLWAFKFLPNWVGNSENELRIMNHESRRRQKNHNSLFMLRDSILDHIEDLAKKFQLKVMSQPKGMERIEAGALYFHPNDMRMEVLKKYRLRLKILAPLDKVC